MYLREILLDEWMDGELFRVLTGMGFVLLVCRAQCSGGVMEGLAFFAVRCSVPSWGFWWKVVRDCHRLLTRYHFNHRTDTLSSPPLFCLLNSLKWFLLCLLALQLCLLLLKIPPSTLHFLQTFNFILKYNWLTTLWQFQVNSQGTQQYIYMYPSSPKFPSHPGCSITLSRVPCATQ